MDDRNVNERNGGGPVYTYRSEDGAGNGPAYTAGDFGGGGSAGYTWAGGRRKGGWKKSLAIFLAVLLVIVLAGVSCSHKVSQFLSSDEEAYVYDSEYVAELHLEGTITNGNSGDGYSQDWILERIQSLTDDGYNKGIMLYVDSPGGSTYATAEVYKAIRNYQEETGRPVYVYMGSMAASGGYYVSAGADKIYANENCWTGSIGVIVGTLYDFSELLDSLGIKAINVTSGENKGMGDSTQPLTDEQVEIYQGLVDDAFDKFVAVVAEGRNMTEAEVREIADGRVYTAGQALENGLIDAVGELEEAYEDMFAAYDLYGCAINVMEYQSGTSIWDVILGIAEKVTEESEGGEYAELFSLIEENSAFTITYLCNARK